LQSSRDENAESFFSTRVTRKLTAELGPVGRPGEGEGGGGRGEEETRAKRIFIVVAPSRLPEWLSPSRSRGPASISWTAVDAD